MVSEYCPLFVVDKTCLTSQNSLVLAFALGFDNFSTIPRKILGTGSMAAAQALFDPALISAEAKAAFPGSYVVRPLQRDDYRKGFFDCLSVLTHVGDISEDRFLERFDWMATQGKEVHYFLVIEHDNRIVGTGTLIVERKL